jgi:3-phenylpropionate/cinnamic acid dioxygenase small subunit
VPAAPGCPSRSGVRCPAVTDAFAAIEALLFRYAAAIDAGDLDAVGALFAEGVVATDDGTVIAEGAEGVRRLYEATTRLHEDGTPRTAHLTTNTSIDVDDDAGLADARSRFVVLQAVPPEGDDPGLALQPIIAGRYHDRFVRVDGEWRFAERRMRPELFGDLARHLLLDPSTITP